MVSALKEKAIERLKTLQSWGDYEAAHEEADKVLCGLLDVLGYDEVIREYIEIHRSFA